MNGNKPAAPHAKGGSAGFVCFICRAPVDINVRGPHKPGCTNAWRNEGLNPWRKEDKQA